MILLLNFLSESYIKKNFVEKILYEMFVSFHILFKNINLREGDRVAAYVPNTIEAVVSFF